MNSPTATSTPPLPTPSPQATNHHPSPTTSNPSTSSPKLPAKKPQPLPWTHQETLNLILAYQEKWYSLKKGQLKASQWEEVSITVAARCGFDEPSKTATQCRHKIEKLRKRYRAERLKPYPNNSYNSWQYFELMDRMERGPLTAQPLAVVNYQHQSSNEINNNSNSDNINMIGYYNHNNDFDASNDESDSEDDFSYGSDVRKNKSKSINHILRSEMGVGSNESRFNYGRMATGRVFGGGNERAMRTARETMDRKRKGYYENEDSEDEEAEEVEVEVDDEGEDDGGKELAAEIRGFAENFMRVEKKKIEMMRETERYRMEMEKKRMEMILESQRKIIDTIGRAFGTNKKVKVEV